MIKDFMNRSELAGILAQSTGMTKVDASAVVSGVFSLISDALVNGDSVRIDGFGTFDVRDRAPRVGRNPLGNVTINIPARAVPYFTPHKTLKDAVGQRGGDKSVGHSI